ncbi:MAG: tRNA 2-thiocytidine biosynthesis protein TtcA [Clostridia bacterium]|nr:tRNA 2-thiocytidine biosynthesis protein TtcA [Clostridia bacterium]
MKQVLGCIRRADERYGMIQDGDKICVGVSGGKDSLLLMYGLKLYQLFSKKKYDLCAVMLDLGIVEQDTSGIEAFAEKNGIDFEVRKTDIGDVVFNIRKEKNPCAMCAKMRRGALNDIAVSKGCNLVALGHNREDVLETFLLSLFFEARLNTFAPITYLGRSGVTVIRPLVFFPEWDARAAAKRLELPVIPANCPVAGKTKREDMRLLLQEFRHIVPDVETKLMKAVVDTHKYGMWDRMKLPPRMTGGVFTGIEGDPAKLLKTGGYAEECKRCGHAQDDEE